MNLYRFQAVWPPATLFAIAGFVTPFTPVNIQALLILFMVVMIADMAARGREYDQALDSLAEAYSKPNFTWRLGLLMARHRGSWCQREMMKAVGATIAPEAHASVCQGYHLDGYRWFHIFPDKTFSASSPFLKARWWKAFFGVRGE